MAEELRMSYRTLLGFLRHKQMPGGEEVTGIYRVCSSSNSAKWEDRDTVTLVQGASTGKQAISRKMWNM